MAAYGDAEIPLGYIKVVVMRIGIRGQHIQAYEEFSKVLGFFGFSHGRVLKPKTLHGQSWVSSSLHRGDPELYVYNLCS